MTVLFNKLSFVYMSFYRFKTHDICVIMWNNKYITLFTFAITGHCIFAVTSPIFFYFLCIILIIQESLPDHYKSKMDIMSDSNYYVNKYKLIFSIQPYHPIKGWPLNDKMINQPRNRNYFPKNFLYRKVRTITGSTSQVINNLLLAILYVILPSKT